MSLVAYESSGDSESNSEEEEEDIPRSSKPGPENQQNGIARSEGPTPTLNAEPADPFLSAAHISDEEDDFGYNSGSDSKPTPGSSGSLHLPAPKNPADIPEVRSSSVHEGNEAASLLLSSLPTPKAVTPTTTELPPGEDELEDMVKPKAAEIASREQMQQKKAKKTIKITVPSLSSYASDEEDEPVAKKLKPSTTGSKLFSLLPEPKNVSIKTAGRSLVPHTLTRPKKPVVPKKPTTVKPRPVHQASAPEVESDEEMEVPTASSSSNFFSIDSPQDSVLLGSSVHSGAATRNPGPAANPQNAPLAFGKRPGQNQRSAYIGPTAMPVDMQPAYPEVSDLYPEEETPESDDAAADHLPGEAYDLPKNIPTDELRRLQGRHKMGKEQINFIEVEAYHKTNTLELLKNIHEYGDAPPPSSKTKEDHTANQKRKHQITFLASQAKAREHDLKNQWAHNKAAKQKTMNKYGF